MIDKAIIYNKFLAKCIVNGVVPENAYIESFAELSHEQFSFAVKKRNNLSELYEFVRLIGGWKTIQSSDTTARNEE